MAKEKQNRIQSKSDVGRIVFRIVLYIWALVIILPLFWMVYTSVKERGEFIADRFKLPTVIWLANYQTAIMDSAAESSLLRYFGNTFLIVAISTVLMLIMVSVTAYVLGKYRFAGKKLFEGFYFAAMLVPSVLVLIPLWFQLRQLGRELLGSNSAITDNILTVSLVYAVQALPAYIFLLVGFVRKIDNSFIEAALMDGAGEYRIFTSIILPQLRPMLVFISLGHIMNVWNEYTLARTFLESESNYTISVGIQSIQNAFTYSFDYGALFASLVLSLLPIMILYLLFQKQILSGTDASEGIKG